MFRHVPNALTGSRLVLAVFFFALLSFYQYQGRGDPALMIAAFAVYLVALITDFLDGYLARRWRVEGKFGRIVDPFVDKVLVLGSFIFFAGKNFIVPEVGPVLPHSIVVHTITGVVPSMVVLILARELLVTSLRSVVEGTGQNFGAALSGKLKMVLQSATILAILIYITFRPWLVHNQWDHAATLSRDWLIWATVLVTAVSGLIYVRRAVTLYHGGSAKG